MPLKLKDGTSALLGAGAGLSSRIIDENVQLAAGELVDVILASREALAVSHVQLRSAQALGGEILEDVRVAGRGNDMAAWAG